MKKSIFPLDLPELEWVQFFGDGFSNPVSGVIYRTGKPPCCGMPLGGVGTGCFDIDAAGVYGYNSLFNPSSDFRLKFGGNRKPRKLPGYQPLLGLAVGGETWVLATSKIIEGGDFDCCMEPHDVRISGGKIDTVTCRKIEGVKPVKEIHYWGHFPILDMEFETDAPVSVGMRAWSPFLPGDAAASGIPAAVFEVHLRNVSDSVKKGTIAFNFPGPDQQEGMSDEFFKRPIREDFNGVMIGSEKGVNYVLGVIGEESPRFGGSLSGSTWKKIVVELPDPPGREDHGMKLYNHSGASAAVDFSIEPEGEKVVRFILTWYAPVWEGAGRKYTRLELMGDYVTEWLGSKWDDANYYTTMYASRYGSSLEVARRMATGHGDLLKKVIAWQSIIYQEGKLPPWLQDSLVNILYLIAEDSYWAQAKPPLGDWCYPGGLFALNESPRGCPQMECIPCDWYGNQPVVFFFPELARSTLKAFKHYQREDGAVPFSLGKWADLPDLATPTYIWQVSLNGTVYIDLIDRIWQRTGDDDVLKEFYESAKKCNTFTINLRQGPGGVISMPEGNQGMEWFESGEWAGMCTHLGGLRLAQLRIMERMARHMRDDEYAAKCRDWFSQGSKALENEMWTGSYYLNFYEKETGKKSDDVMAYQFDGQWATAFHELPGVFKPDRVNKTLQTIKKCNVALTPAIGAANFARPDGSPLMNKQKVAAYGAFAMFPPELLVLAMTYIYTEESEFGLDLARRHWENIVLKQRHPWDAPNVIQGDSGKRTMGTDYYQNMMLWSLPAAMEGIGIKGFCAAGGLIDRIIQSAKRV